MNGIDASYIVNMLGAIIGFTCMLLISLVSWNWMRLHKKIDEIVLTVKSLAEDVRNDINDHEVRITVVEKHLDMHRRRDDVP